MAILASADVDQIRVERGERALERAAKLRNGPAPRLSDRTPFGRIDEQGPDAHRKLAGIADRLGPMRDVERGVDFGEIPDVRTVQNGGPELDGLDRVVPPDFCQRTAGEHDRGEPIDQPEFAKG